MIRSMDIFMKKWIGKAIMPIVSVAAAIGIAFIGIKYYKYTSNSIYDDTASHLNEIYSQVNRSFGSFAERNRAILYGWEKTLVFSDDEEKINIANFIAEEQENWNFSDFYFISENKTAMTLNGDISDVDFGSAWELLMNEKKNIMAGHKLADGREVTVFAVPAEHAEYNGFTYDAIAISYTNADIVSSLNVDAFSGTSKCFIIHEDGSVLLSTQTGGNVFDNYLVYLEAVSDLDEAKLEEIRTDWELSNSNILQCNIKGDTYCILYQPVGFQNLILLSIVPQEVLNSGFLDVQKTTVYVLVSIFMLLASITIAYMVIRNHKRSHETRMELQYRERMFDVLSNSVNDIFIMVNSDNGEVNYVSPNIERLLGIQSRDAQKDLTVMEKCSADKNVLIPKDEMNNIPLNGSISREYEYTHQKTGERHWYRMTAYHMSIQGVRKFIFVLSDRTEDRQLNNKLQEALDAAKSANEAKSNFLSNMSHDIRTPMNAIVGFSVLLEKDADNPEKVREYTRKISSSSHHLLSLINDVLDMSKIESGKTSLNVDKFSLPELLDELNVIIMPQAKAKKQEFIIDVKGTPPEQMVGDKLRLNQILINLLSNAVKYTPVGGKIDFTVSELRSDSSQYVKLSFVVKDNGIGMSEDFRDIIFEPFSREISSVTNKIRGTGLGMAITKNLVELMGGIINVESRLNEGSTFTVELSFVLPEQDKMNQWYRSKVTRILVADDEEDICINIKELMSDSGVEISFAENGKEAVDTAIKAHRSGNDFNVILLDWKMPVMDGVEAAEKIRNEIGKNIPILVLTSYDWSDIEDEARRAGINAFMPKPFFVSTFWQTLKPMFHDEFDFEQQDIDTDASDSVMKDRLFLVAEDNELNAEILSEMLNMEGAKCEIAVNGEEAVEMFTRSEKGHYDMILMDVQMPIMNGYEATKKIRSSSHPEAKAIPIAAMTANTFAEDVRNSMDAGMDGHLAKPIDMNAVRELVGKLLARTEADDKKI